MHLAHDDLKFEVSKLTLSLQQLHICLDDVCKAQGGWRVGSMGVVKKNASVCGTGGRE